MINIEDEFYRLNKLTNEMALKECFKNDISCSKDIINAHSIQNNRILKKISRNGYVMFYDYSKSRENSMFELTECGRKKATTFTGFCGYHDNEIFKPIELFDYTKGNEEQEFLFAYRALAKEYHSKLTTLKVAEKILEYIRSRNIEKINYYFPGTEINDKEKLLNIETVFNTLSSGCKIAKSRLEKNKAAMNTNLDRRRFSKVQSDVIVFDEEYNIAVSSACVIERDLKGNIINDLYAPDISYITSLFFTLFPQGGKTYVLFSYFKKDKHVFEFIKDQILTKSIEEQKTIISNIIVLHIENFAFSPDIWDRMSKKEQEDFNFIFASSINIKPEKLLYYPKLNIFR